MDAAADLCVMAQIHLEHASAWIQTLDVVAKAEASCSSADTLGSLGDACCAASVRLSQAAIQLQVNTLVVDA